MRVKVCGMREARNIAEIAGLTPDYMGFIFYEGSPRFAGSLAPEALDILSPTTKRVGVFVNAPIDYILKTTERYGLNLVQLHGAESPEFCAALRKKTGIIKAFGIGTADDFQNVEQYEGSCDYYIFDTKTSNHGGSGCKFDHNLLHKYTGRTPYLLSGGLAAEDANLLLALKDDRCIGFDINSRFETAPGIKDPLQVKIFIKTIKNRQK